MPATLAVTGWGVLSPLGAGADEFSRALADGRSALADVSGMFDEPLPQDKACAITDFDVREHLGRKRTASLDRSTAFAVTASGMALADAGLVVDDDNRDEVGVVLGTTLGSLRATAEFDRETLVNERPYMVEPLLFPNAVMNCAASRCAIWYQLRGVNCTVPAGELSAVSVLRYGRTLISRGHAGTLLLGATEEFGAHRAWGDHHTRAGDPSRAPLGEAAVVLVTEDARAARAAGRPMDAEILSVESGHCDGDGAGLARALAERIRAALGAAGVTSDQVAVASTGEGGTTRLDTVEQAALREVFGPGGPERLRVKEFAGDCGGAAGMVQIAAVLARHRAGSRHDDEVSLVTSVSPDGAVGAVVLRGWSRRGSNDGR
ncbi:beta-ketoacyl synthase N-terminal-like domain-containing protein [Streptomyces sp. NRRL B-3648]|uniref:beta-ketoacyl synthase N-terminal-like domain-containing protein n=1 Tax=Streptomyces sp. NRRL B-3648 TaxID=1519493 RepID=UPI0006AE6078|nr:beta-ketoacyl synthase N-terminal-like domain-containing protein [Streptomyces sp. NRRL B-3648]